MLSVKKAIFIDSVEEISVRLRNSLLFLVVSCSVIVACESKEFTKDAAESYKIAKEPYDDENYLDALTRLQEYKSRFPYSQYAVEAELLIAHTHFQLEQFEEAAAAYAQFVKLHPRHPELAFAMYRVGESYWSLSPDDIDREQEFTHKAVEEWEKLIGRLPQSSYAKKAKKLVKEGKLRIARSYEFVAKFYCKLEIYHACAFRYIKLARLYPEFADMRRNALEEASRSLMIVSEQKKEDPKSDKNIYFNKLDSGQIADLARKLKNESRNDRPPK